MKFHELPEEMILNIFSWLDYRDLQRLCFVNRRCNDVVNTESLWKCLCVKHWLLSRKSKGTWKESFAQYYKEYGRYIGSYPKIKNAWNRLESFLQVQCPGIYQSLQAGVSEEEIDRLQSRNSVDLPEALRLFYRIHGGQVCIDHSEAGLFGSLASNFVSHLSSLQYINPLASEVVPCGLDPKKEFITDIASSEAPGYRTITICSDDINSTEICVLLPTRGGPTLPESVGFSLPSSGSVIGKLDMDVSSVPRYSRKYHAIADTFEEWFLDFVEKTLTGIYPVHNGSILRYKYEPSCVARTGSITVKAGWAHARVVYTTAMSEKMLFEYRITMSMDDNASEADSCKLMERHWFIENFSDGAQERVDGPGVVGEFPIMRPGASYSWMSRTCFDPPGGSMEGFFTMRSLRNSSKTEVKCPRFVMEYPLIYQRSRQAVDP